MKNLTIKEIDKKFSIPNVSPWDYTLVGLLVIDNEPSLGFKRMGGTAFYSGVQASALGLKTGIITKGNVEEIAALWENAFLDGDIPKDTKIEIWVEPSEHTTTFLCEGRGESRKQLVEKYSGPISHENIPKIGNLLHLGPVVQEIEPEVFESINYDNIVLGLQGFVRKFQGLGKEYSWETPKYFNKIIGNVSICGGHELEEECSRQIMKNIIDSEGSALVTHGKDPVEILTKTTRSKINTLEVSEVDDYGDGDIFSAGVAYGLLNYLSIEESVKIGCKVAAYALGKVGVSDLLTNHELQNR